MLQKINTEPSGSFNPGRHEAPAELLDFVSSLTRRHLWLIVIIVGLTIAISAVYLLTARSKYTAEALMVIDTHQAQLSQQQASSTASDMAIDPGAVETQVEIMKSENISLAVIRELHLNQDPEFAGGPSGLFRTVTAYAMRLLRPAATENNVDLDRRVLAKFSKAESIKRVGMTYVMNISFTSTNPAKAARIANAIADAYVTDQLESKYQVTRRASAWLQDRINELRIQSANAERAVVDFKSKNNIIDSGGRLMNDQQMTEISSQLVLARAATAEAEARYNRIKDLTKQDIPDGSVADSLKNDVIIRLRGQYVDLAAKEAIWSQKYGINHLATVGLRNQMREIRKSISGELERIANSYLSDYTIAKTRQESIEASLAKIVADTQITSKSSIQLRELESGAQTSRTMYDTLLQRYMEAVQQSSFPISESRLISPASKPIGRSSPKSLLVLGGGAFAGLLLAYGTAYLRDRTDSAFRTPRQIEEALALPCLACVPRLQSASRGVANEGLLRNAEIGRLLIGHSHYTHVIDRPLSLFSEAMRSVKVAIDLKSGLEKGRIIGITSSVPNEGKSTIASNLAYLMASGGSRVALLDADLRNPNLSRRVDPGKEVPGLLTACKSGQPLTTFGRHDDVVGLDFIPSGSAVKELHTYEILSSKQMCEAIVALKREYDYIIVDLPPLHPVVDARGSIRFVDDYVFVVEWGRTSANFAERSLDNAREIFDKTLGVVMNKSDVLQIGRYDRSFTSSGKDKQYYERYGYAA